MQPRITSILRSVNDNPDRPLNILTAATHERYQTNLSKLPHKFFLCDGPDFNKWKTNHTPVPPGHIILNRPITNLPTDIHFDMILAQNKFSQMQNFKPLADALSCPLISLEHTWPRDNMPDEQKQALAGLRGDINVFISKISMEAWGFSSDDPSVRIIQHGIDTTLFRPSEYYISKNKSIASCVNNFAERDYACGFKVWQEITKGLNTVIMGENKGVSKPAKDIHELIEFYQTCGVFLNTSLRSPIPTVVLEAMACGCCVVSTATCAIPDIIQDGQNGFISNDYKYLRDRVLWCLDHPKESEEMGQKARQTILERFTLDKHIEEWSKVINELRGKAHAI